jgi:hypothetical protein
MANDFEKTLDSCIDRLNRGESVEACMADYPQYASELEPLLQAMFTTRQAYTFSPSPKAKREARQKFLAALEQRRQPGVWQKIFAQRLVWASVAAAVVLIIVGYFGLRTFVLPSEPPVLAVASAAPNGNFAFLMTDDINAIDEFSKLDVSVEKIGLLNSGDSEGWVEFVPEVQTFDLTPLRDGVTQQLWQGNIPEGQYTKVRLYITQAQGTLEIDSSMVDIKIPSERLQFDVSTSFQISSANITSFTYDLTVFNRGKGPEGEKYYLKPVINQSGVHQALNPGQDKSKADKSLAMPDTLTPLPVSNNRKNNL